MIDYATPTAYFATHTGLALEVAFDGGRLTSNGGLPWLSMLDQQPGMCATMAIYVPEWCGARVRHSLLALVQQRVYQIACGYEDQNDAYTLRSDPLLKRVCGRLPETGAELASHPTLFRLENAVCARACYRRAVALGSSTSANAAGPACYCQQRVLPLSVVDNSTLHMREC
jgi:hypothetical protein